MPCTDGGVPYGPTEAERYCEPALCAVLHVLESNEQLPEVLAAVDWREAGVAKRWVERWWARHKQEDARRREYEAEQKQARKLAARARAKLTPAERRALGL
jgi:hypothetical protein